MPNEDDHDLAARDALQLPEWDAASILRQRADRSRADRDRAIADLRKVFSDEEILDELGIDLDRIEG